MGHMLLVSCPRLIWRILENYAWMTPSPQANGWALMAIDTSCVHWPLWLIQLQKKKSLTLLCTSVFRPHMQEAPIGLLSQLIILMQPHFLQKPTIGGLCIWIFTCYCDDSPVRASCRRGQTALQVSKITL